MTFAENSCVLQNYEIGAMREQHKRKFFHAALKISLKRLAGLKKYVRPTSA